MNISSDSHNQPKSTAILPVHFVRDARHPLFRAEEKAVLFAIASRMKTTTDTAYPGLKKIALDAGVGLSTATRVVTWALEIGILILVPDDDRKGRSFLFDYERLANLPANLPRRTAGKANVAAPASANKKAFPGKGIAFPGNATTIPREGYRIPRECLERDVVKPVPGNAHPIPRDASPHSPGMTKDQEKDQSKEQEPVGGMLVSTRATEEADPWDLKGDTAPLTPRSPSFPASPSPKHVEAPATKDKSVVVPRLPKLKKLDVSALNIREREVYDAIMGDETLSKVCINVERLARDLVEAGGPGLDVVDEVKKAARWNRNTPLKAWSMPRGGNKGLTTWVERARKQPNLFAPNLFAPTAAPTTREYEPVVPPNNLRPKRPEPIKFDLDD